MLKAIIFDFDGVIVDTEEDRFDYLKRELKKYHYILEDKDFPNVSGRRTINAIKDLFPDIPSDIVEKINNDRKNIQKQNIIKLKPISGLKKLLILLSKKNKLAIGTGSSKDVVKTFLDKKGLTKYFDKIICSEDFDSSKPDPECYILTLKKLKVKPSEAIIIEDSEAGITAGKKIGCKVFGLKNEYNAKQLKNADKTFNNYKELSEYFKSLKC